MTITTYPIKGGVYIPLPLASIEKLIRKAGAHRVSKSASKELASHLEDVAAEVAREAIAFSEHAGRKTVNANDIKLAKRVLFHDYGPGPKFHDDGPGPKSK